MKMNRMDIQQAAANKVLIAAHRGAAGGNIPCNTLAAFKTALRQGTDIIELDISRSGDGVLYVFHPGMELHFLRSDALIPQMTASQVDAMRVVNQDGTPTAYGVPRLEEALKELQGKCYINLDKFWTCPEEIGAMVRRLGMQDQVLIKTTAAKENFARVEECAWDIPYMVIAQDCDDFTQTLLSRKMRYIGVEALFKTEDAPIAQTAYLQKMRERGLITWVNSIVYDYKAVLAAHHNDDIAVSEGEDLGWGWLIDRGFGIIQTDWPLMLHHYLRKRGLR